MLAPELPGIRAGSSLSSIAAYATWLERVLDARGLDRVALVGNSLGAAIAWHFASTRASRVRAMVLVNGGSFAPHGPLVRRFSRVPGGIRLLRWMLAFNTYGPRTVRRAFADPALAPAEVRQFTAHGPRRLVDDMLELMRAGDDPSLVPLVPALIVWGREDHLMGVSPRTAEALRDSIPNARLAFIDDAGHLPQVEQSTRFVAILQQFVADHPA